MDQAEAKRNKGYLNSKIVKAVTFYIITGCVIASVILCILAIWEFADPDVFWRMIATFFVIAFGSGVFAFINNLFGTIEYTDPLDS
jgi:drug/metabolite transporter (DMT)-like permease